MTRNAAPALVLLSGGMDSTVLLHHVAKDLRHTPIQAVSFRYGQRHAKEIESAQWQAAAAGVALHKIIDLSLLAELVRGGTSLVEGGADIPDLANLSEENLGQPPTYVPNRNMVLLSVAAAYAEAQGIRDLFYGAQAHDEYGYWDCTEDFLRRINALLALNRNEPITVHAPFVGKKKSELVELGLRLRVDFAHTWSCYRGQALACRTCPTCVERINAFREAGLDDPLSYASTQPQQSGG